MDKEKEVLKRWLEKNNEIIEFEEGACLPSKPENKWKFYFRIQEALEGLHGYTSSDCKIAERAELSGQVVVREGARILPGAFIEGPAYVGKNTLVGNSALIRANSFLSAGSVVGNHCYCTAGVLGPKAGAFHFSGISRSVLERNCRVSAFVVTGTTRPDLKTIEKNLPPSIDRDTKKRGCTIGENTFLGAHVATVPGIDIGKNSFIGNFVTVDENIPEETYIVSKIPTERAENKLETVEVTYPEVKFRR